MTREKILKVPLIVTIRVLFSPELTLKTQFLQNHCFKQMCLESSFIHSTNVYWLCSRCAKHIFESLENRTEQNRTLYRELEGHKFGFVFFLFVCLSFWLRPALVAARGIFVLACRILKGTWAETWRRWPIFWNSFMLWPHRMTQSPDIFCIFRPLSSCFHFFPPRRTDFPSFPSRPPSCL